MVKKNALIKNISLILGTLLLMGLIVFLVGRAFGFFQYAKHGEVVNFVTIKGLDVDIINDSDEALNLTNAYPMYDDDGLNQTPFVFELSNNSSKALDYTLKMENDTDKQSSCVLSDNITPCTTLSTSYIKYAYKLDNGSYSEPQNLGSNNGIILSDTIYGNATVKVSLVIWVDKDAPNSIQSQVFYGSLVLSAGKSTYTNSTVTDTTVAYVSNGLNKKLTDLQIIGNTVSSNNVGQDGTIDLVVSGKNLINYSLINDWTGYGITKASDNDGCFTVSGTWDGNSTGFGLGGHTFTHVQSLNIISRAGNYTVSLNGKNDSLTTIYHPYFYVNQFYNNSQNNNDKYAVSTGKDNTNAYTYNFTQDRFEYDDFYVAFGFWVTKPENYIPATVCPQLEYGSTKTEFEPYKEMRYTIELKDTSNNTITGLGSGDTLKKVNNSWVIDNGNTQTELSSSTQQVLNNIIIYEGISNIWVDDTVSIGGISVTYQKSIN